MVQTLVLVLTVASWAYWLVAWCFTRSFFGAEERADPDSLPAVSILKPVKGLDADAYQSFASFCYQDYPEFELLFGVADASDPSIPLIQRLQREHFDRRIRLIVAPNLGANSKASILHALAHEAAHDVLAISDSDMRVTPSYLQRVVAPLGDKNVGLVTCPYRCTRADTFAARLEALYVGLTFLPSVMVARRVLDMRFALGASVTVRRRDLDRIGGFAALTPFLADDYEIGARIAALGLKVRLSTYVMDAVLGATTFREWWSREKRWMQCSRISQPLKYPGLLLTFSTPLAALYLALSDFGTRAWQVIILSLLVRWAVGWMISGYTEDRESRRLLMWLPLRDTVTLLVWVAALWGRRVWWRGEEYVLYSDGTFAPLMGMEGYPVRGRARWWRRG